HHGAPEPDADALKTDAERLLQRKLKDALFAGKDFASIGVRLAHSTSPPLSSGLGAALIAVSGGVGRGCWATERREGAPRPPAPRPPRSAFASTTASGAPAETPPPPCGSTDTSRRSADGSRRCLSRRRRGPRRPLRCRPARCGGSPAKG